MKTSLTGEDDRFTIFIINSNLKRELKMTDIEELRIQSETYYQEVQRMQLAMLQMQQDRINYTSSMTE